MTDYFPCAVFDIGASNTRISISPDPNTVLNPIIYPTPSEPTLAVQKIKQTLFMNYSKFSIKAIVGGVAGPLNKDKTGLLKPPNLSKWAGFPLVSELKKAFNVPVIIQNDTALVGLGEYFKGAGKGSRILVYVTVSTGVNGARILNDKLDEGVYGSEIGKQLINFNHTLENLISGAALEKKYKKPPYKIKNKLIWKQINKILAIGLYNSILHWSPDTIVIGGGLSRSLNMLNLKTEIHKILSPVYPDTPKIKKAILGDKGGLWGAVYYIKSHLKSRLGLDSIS